MLRNWRKEAGRQMGVESDVILPREALQAIAENNPGSPEDLAAILQPFPWRLEHYGEQILQVLGLKRKAV
jgi:ribonuclease D